jgi:hypothetical protein
MNPLWILGGLLAIAVLAAVREVPAGVRHPFTGRRIATPEEKRAILHELQQLGWPAAEVDRVIQLESGWESTARNTQSGASGLLQLLPSRLAEMGFMPDATPFASSIAFAALPPSEQQPYIVEYFRRIGRRWRQPGDTYLAVFAPSALGQPDSHVIFQPGTAGWALNKPLREGPEGPITAGSVRRKGMVA